jgi:hypothetical protein
VLRIYYLVQKADPSEILLLSTSMSSQDYQVNQQYQSGAGVLSQQLTTCEPPP